MNNYSINTISDIVSLLVCFGFICIPLLFSVIVGAILLYNRYKEAKEENFEKRRS